MGLAFFNIPTFLTLVRLVVSPLTLPILLVYLLPLQVMWINCALAILFVFFSLTDFFDGFLARRYCQVTSVGSLLDPIADKFLVYSTLIALLVLDKIYFYWVIILIGREFFVMGLRNIALEIGISVTVSWFGKIKTAIQMIFLTIVIVNPYQSLGLLGALGWNGVELLLLVLTLIFSVWSAYTYYLAFIKQFKIQQSK